MSLVFKNVIIRIAVLFSEILLVWLNRNKFCHCLTKPIITRIIVSLVLENVIIRIEIIVSRDFMTLVKYVQILSLFNQAYIITRIIMYLVFENVIMRIEIIVFRDFITLVKYVQILSLFNQAHYHTNYCVFSVGKCYYKD